MTFFKTAAAFLACSLLTCSAASQPTIQTLLDEVRTGSSSAAAEKQLESRGSEDPGARVVLSDRLPLLLAQTKDVNSTLLFVQLAGALKLVSTIPALSALLTGNEYMTMCITLYQQAELIDDPIGAALAHMGESSVPEVSALLQSPNPRTRSRAVRVLTKIGTTNAIRAVRLAGESEKDPQLRGMMLDPQFKSAPKRPQK